MLHQPLLCVSTPDSWAGGQGAGRKEVGKEGAPRSPLSLGKWGNQARTGACHRSVPKDAAGCLGYPMRASPREAFSEITDQGDQTASHRCLLTKNPLCKD